MSLQNYNQQAKTYHNSCVLEIRDQLERFETSVAEISPVVIEDVRRQKSDELKKKLNKMQAEWGQKADDLEQQRVSRCVYDRVRKNCIARAVVRIWDPLTD